MGKQSTSRSRTGAFTLLELVIVLGIIGMFSGIGISGIKGIRMWMDKSETNALFADIEMACRLYRLEKQAWPTGLELGEKDLLHVILPYMESRDGIHALVDGYGNSDIRVVFDDDGDGMIERTMLKGLNEDDLPEFLFRRIAVYSINESGNLAAANWL